MQKLGKSILLILLLTILWLPLLQGFTDYFKDPELKGAFVKPENPKFSIDSLWSQGYQNKFEEYLRYNFGFKGLFVKIRNSLNYILFRELSLEDNVVGKNGFIFSRGSTIQTTGMQYAGKEKNERTIQGINYLKTSLEEEGVHFLVVIAPSKEFIYPDYLPSPYREEFKSNSNYLDFIQGYRESNIPVIDFSSYFKYFRDTSDYPVFTKTGFHWSMYAASLAQDSILNFMAHSLSKPMPQYRNKGIEVSDTARISDADFEEPLNLFFSLEQPPYFYRKSEIIKSSESNHRPKVIIIGDSFFWIIKHQKMLPHIFSEDSRYWYYFKRSCSLLNEESIEMKHVNVIEELESADFVILFSNIATLYEFPYGLTDYYYENSSDSGRSDYGMSRRVVSFKAANNKYICADGARGDTMVADRDFLSTWETFTLVHLRDDKYAIYSYARKFLSAQLAHQNEIVANRNEMAEWETFTMVKLDSNHVAFKAFNGKYLSFDERSLQLYASGESIGGREKFQMVVKQSSLE